MKPSIRITEALRQGIAAHRGGKLEQADFHYGAVLRLDRRNFDALHLLGLVRWQQGRNEEAASLIGQALRVDPRSAEACSNLGIVLEALGRPAEALAMYDRALAINPRYAKAQSNRGDALRALHRFDEALASYDRALAIEPNFVDALLNRGIVLRELGRNAEALECYSRVLAVYPNFAEGYYNQANTLDALGRHEEALASYDRALTIRPQYAQAWSNRGNTLNRLTRHEEVLASCDRAVAINPELSQAYTNRGNALLGLQRYEGALESLDTALRLNPCDAEALNSRATALSRLHRHAEALASYDDALAIAPNHADALYNRGQSLILLDRYGEAIASYRRALAIKPDFREAGLELIRTQLLCCDWNAATLALDHLRVRSPGQDRYIDPFNMLWTGAAASEQLKSARGYLEKLIGTSFKRLVPAVKRDHARIRIGYLSADFRQHPVSTMIRELFKLHDRSQFEVMGISFGPDDGSELRASIIESFDKFFDVHVRSDYDIARLLQDLEIDIAVDLMGLTYLSRPGILAHRPSPIQVSYLGYPATTGADFLDYVIADPIVLPFDQQAFFTERIVHLPDCYLPSDSQQRKISHPIPSRDALGLPPERFVFCAFTQPYKITAAMFDIWMRLLRSVEGAVLWLSQANEIVVSNLSREAENRDVDPARLIFAPTLHRLTDHLARLGQADLYLDTLPYNAHTSASNALWAGLPMVTCKGDTFAGRVGASVLYAARLPELVAASLKEYEVLALRLATDDKLLNSIRRKLDDNLETCPLFDSDRFRRHIEAGYITMWEMHRRGEPPRTFAVEPK